MGGFTHDLHPMVVHFPVALLVTGLALEAAAAVSKRPQLRQSGLLLLGLGFVAAIAAVLTGLTNPEVGAVRHTLAVTPPDEPGTRALFLQRLTRIRVHQRLAYSVLASCGVALLVRLWRGRGRAWAAASVVSGLAVLVAVVATGIAGGRLAR